MTYCSISGLELVKLEGSRRHDEHPSLPGLARQRGGFVQQQGSPLSREPGEVGDPPARGLEALVGIMLTASPAHATPL